MEISWESYYLLWASISSAVKSEIITAPTSRVDDRL